MKPQVYIINSPPSWVKTPPLSLTYLKAYLQAHKIEVTVSDLNLTLYKLTKSTLKQWLSLDSVFESSLFERLWSTQGDLFSALFEEIAEVPAVGFSLSKRNYHFSMSLAEKIHQRFDKKKIIFGGPHVLWLDQAGPLDRRFSWVVGEGESAMLKSLSSDAGSVHRFEELENIDTLPFYDFSPLCPSDYSISIPLLASRGCPYSCAFCSERSLYRTFRSHSVEYMIAHIERLIATYQSRNFVFLDSLINFDQEWLTSFCTELIRRNIEIKWEAQIRIAGNFPYELADLMRRSGCFNLFVGLESASDSVLRRMRKGFGSADALRFFKTLTQAGLHFEISLIFGYMSENEIEFDQTLQFIIKNKKYIPKIAQANPYVDYSHDSTEPAYAPQARIRIQRFLRVLESEKIKYTKSFINNLIYE